MPDAYEGLSAGTLGELLRRGDAGAIAHVRGACAPGESIAMWADKLLVSRRTLERWLKLTPLADVPHPPVGFNLRRVRKGD